MTDLNDIEGGYTSPCLTFKQARLLLERAGWIQTSKGAYLSPNAAHELGLTEALTHALVELSAPAPVAAPLALTVEQRQTLWSILQNEYDAAQDDVIDAELNACCVTEEVIAYREEVDTLRKLVVPEPTHATDINSK